MPELPDVTVYVEALEERLVGQLLEKILLGSPFVLRSVTPSPSEVEGRRVVEIRRLGKRVVIGLERETFLVVHLMIAGRFRWKEGSPRPKLVKRRGLARFDFSSGTLTLTEEGSKKRASLHLVDGEENLRAFRRRGIEVLDATIESFTKALKLENHTLKRSLTDPHLFSGIGNAYSDEILHRARLSPVQWSSRLTEEEVGRLYQATRTVLTEWTERLREEFSGRFPDKVTAFRPEMAVHGRYGKPCPICASPVQRIAYAENETNYCPQCQTNGKLLADRALSRLLKGDWPKSLDELEDHMAKRRG